MASFIISLVHFLLLTTIFDGRYFEAEASAHNKKGKRNAHRKSRSNIGQQEQGRVTFQKRPETSHVDCGRVLRNDAEYITTLVASRPRLVERELDMSCDAVRKRVLPPRAMQQLKFGVAFARIVYTDYEFIEDELTASYHSQNLFCYSVDKKAPESFADRFNALSKCLPNVMVTEERFDVNSAGHDMNHAHYACLKLLIQKKGWRYAVLMQNYDMMIKSVYETVAILDELGGANAISVIGRAYGRYDPSLKWNTHSLHFFQGKKVKPRAELNLVFGAVQAALSRKAVKWMVNTVNLTTLMNQLNTERYGVDEVLLASLHVSDGFDMPGRFTAKCMRKNYVMDSIVRLARWHGDKTCATKEYRHGICILGIEEFKMLAADYHLMANKPLSNFDYSVIDCTHELLFNRTHLGQLDHKLHRKFYRNLIYVRYHRNRLRPQPGYRLDCTEIKTRTQ